MTEVTFKKIIVDGRCYFNDGKRYALVDTGYGMTMSVDREIGPFMAFPVLEDDLQSFNPTIMPDGQKIGAILCPMCGCNVLIGEDTVTIDNETRKEVPECRWFIPFVHPAIPVVECKIDGKAMKLFFDSGMRLPVIDDDSLVEGKEQQGTQLEWIGIEKGLYETPKYNARFEFPCGYNYEGHVEHDCIHAYVSKFRKAMGVEGFVGLQSFSQFNVLIVGNGNKRGIALIER